MKNPSLRRTEGSKLTLGTHIAFRNNGNIWEGKEHKTNEYEVCEINNVQGVNVKEVLGYIRWFPRWRKYAFAPIESTVYEETCMREISQFIEEETAAHKAKNGKQNSPR